MKFVFTDAFCFSAYGRYENNWPYDEILLPVPILCFLSKQALWSLQRQGNLLDQDAFISPLL